MKKTNLTLLVVYLSCILFACDKNDGNVGPSESNPVSQSGKGGSLARSTIINKTMYFVDNSTIQVYDLSVASDPKLVNKINITNSNTIETIYALGKYLYLGSSNGMFIYDISNKFSPRYLSMATHVSGCDPVVSDGKYAYVTVRNSSACNRFNTINILEIFDVTNPSQPNRLSTLSLTEPIGLAIDGDILFVCDQSALKVIDVSNRRNPNVIKSIPSNAYDIIIDGNNILTVGYDGITQYEYDRENLTLNFKSTIKTAL
jgi:hypothetical protein